MKYKIYYLAIILVMLQGCCNAGGIKGAIEYQVDACSKTGFSAFAFDMSGQYGGYYEDEPETDPQLLNEMRKQTNALQSQAQALHRANWCTAHPDSC